MRAGIGLLLAHTAAGVFMSASDPMVLWQGRPNVNSADGSVSFDWEGTAASFGVAGKAATVTLYTNVTLAPGNVGRISVYINDYDVQNMLVHSGTGSYLVAAALTNDVNNVTVYYSVEPVESGVNKANNEVVTFFGFEAGNGGSFVSIAPLNRRIDIIGDSITAGSGYDKLESVNGPLSFGTGCNPWAPVTGNSQAFNWENYLCRYFRANCTTAAWSGGTLLDPTGSNCNGRAWLPQLYPRAYATGGPAYPWDFSRVSRPDAVIIFLGTNDYGCNMTTDAKFTAAQLELMGNITQYYSASPASPAGAGAAGEARFGKPNEAKAVRGASAATASPIQFLLVVGPMSPVAPYQATMAAIAQATAQGMKASFLDMRYNVTLDGCGGHPGPIGHWQMALAAAPQIRSVMGW